MAEEKEDKSYLECNLPVYLKISIDEYEDFIAKYEQGIEKIYHWDLYEDALVANINAAESGNEISSEQAWYLREKHLGIKKEDLIWKD